VLDALSWYIAIQALGILALPAAFVLLRRLPDRGFTLAKPAAMVFFSYILWVLGLTHIAPNTRLTIFVILIVAAVPSGFLLHRSLEEIKDFARRHWPMLLTAEILFLGFFLMWLGIVSEVPAINHTEKPMDFGFMNAVLQSRFFPPEDPWLSGNSISYYYFGHFMMAFLTQLTGVASSVGYNLGVSLVPGLVAIGAFGLVYNLVRLSGGSLRAGIIFGGAAPVLILLAGNLEGAMEFAHLRDWGGIGFWEWVSIKGLTGADTGSGGYPDGFWWWFRASRVIDTLAGGQSLDYTITEFPVFSLILGDLHPHVMNLPFVILGLGLTLNLFQSTERLGLAWLRYHPLEAAAAALFIGSLAFINIWDLPVIAGMFGAAALVKSYGDHGGNLTRGALGAAVVVVPVLVLAVVLFLPFYDGFEAQTSGILPLRDVNTRPFLLFLVLGPFILLAVSFLFRQIAGLTRPSEGDNSAAVLIMVVASTPFLVWIAVAFFVTWIDDGTGAAFGEIGGRMVLVVPGLALVALAGFSAMQRVRLNVERTAAFPLLLAALAFFLLVGAELFYVVDQFGGSLRRMNTVFKTYYQAWLLLGIAGSYGLYYLWSVRSSVQQSVRLGRFSLGRAPAAGFLRAGRLLWAGAAIVLLVASFYYPVGAALDRTGILRDGHTLSDNTLDGLAFLKQPAPGEYAAIQWLRDDAPWGRMVEAVGDDYTDFARISSSTGLPTVLGWEGHELQWRSSYSSFRGRADDVRAIFSSGDPDEVRRLLNTYEVRYVYLGSRERRTYGGENLAHFGAFLKTAFEQDGVIVYEMFQPTAENR
jgi:YYY domain-containing protein